MSVGINPPSTASPVTKISTLTNIMELQHLRDEKYVLRSQVLLPSFYVVYTHYHWVANALTGYCNAEEIMLLNNANNSENKYLHFKNIF